MGMGRKRLLTRLFQFLTAQDQLKLFSMLFEVPSTLERKAREQEASWRKGDILPSKFISAIKLC